MRLRAAYRASTVTCGRARGRPSTPRDRSTPSPSDVPWMPTAHPPTTRYSTPEFANSVSRSIKSGWRSIAPLKVPGVPDELDDRLELQPRIHVAPEELPLACVLVEASSLAEDEGAFALTPALLPGEVFRLHPRNQHGEGDGARPARRGGRRRARPRGSHPCERSPRRPESGPPGRQRICDEVIFMRKLR